jgi:hypothetical protein
VAPPLDAAQETTDDVAVLDVATTAAGAPGGGVFHGAQIRRPATRPKTTTPVSANGHTWRLRRGGGGGGGAGGPQPGGPHAGGPEAVGAHAGGAEGVGYSPNGTGLGCPWTRGGGPGCPATVGGCAGGGTGGGANGCADVGPGLAAASRPSGPVGGCGGTVVSSGNGRPS